MILDRNFNDENDIDYRRRRFGHFVDAAPPASDELGTIATGKSKCQASVLEATGLSENIRRC